MKNIKHLSEASIGIGTALGKLNEREQRKLVLKMLGSFLDFLESVQESPMLERLIYYEGAFHVYDYLRRNHQLGRRVGQFDREVKEEIVRILSKYLYDNGL